MGISRAAKAIAGSAKAQQGSPFPTPLATPD
jgi:hypothetical protein